MRVKPLIRVWVYLAVLTLMARGAEKTKVCVNALLRAVESQRVEEARRLLEAGCPVDETGGRGSPPLRLAVRHESSAMTELLLEYGADPNQDLGDRLSPFHHAAGSAPTATLALLYRAGGAPNTLNPRAPNGYYTPLIWAIDSGRLDNARFLLTHGADPNLTRAGGATPLAGAVMRLNSDMMGLLLEHGADVNRAYSLEGEDCIACPFGITVLHQMAGMWTWGGIDREDLKAWVRRLVEAGADPNRRDDSGYTPLDHALSLGSTEVAELLIDLGAEIHGTSLHNAARFSYPACVRLVLAHGADVRSLDGEGRNALHVCITCCGDGFGEGIDPGERRDTVALLLDAGCDPRARDGDGSTFLDHCRNLDHMPVKELLISRRLLRWTDLAPPAVLPYDREGRIAGDEPVRIRRAPSLKAPVVGRAAPGSRVGVSSISFDTFWVKRGTKESWVAVTSEGTTGFVHGDFVALLQDD